MKAYVAVQKKLLTLLYTLWKNDTVYVSDYSVSKTETIEKPSGNEELRPSFPLFFEEKIINSSKKVVPSVDGTTQDKHQYKESPEVFFPLLQN
jgi:transposase